MESRVQLLTQLELAPLRNEVLRAADMIIAEREHGVLNSGARNERLGNPARKFYTPIEPFLVNGMPAELRRGEIAWSSLSPIWAWLCRDVMPQEARRYCDRMKRALLARDVAAATGLSNVFRPEALKSIDRAIFTVGKETISDRLAMFMGSPRAFDDLLEIVKVFKARDVLATLASTLPTKISDLAGEELDHTIAALDRLVEADATMVLYGLILVMRRLAAPWQLVRLAFRAAGSRSTAEIVNTPLALAVGLALRATEDLAGRAREQLQDPEDGFVASETLTLLSVAIKGLSDLEMPAQCVWRKRLSALGREFANLQEVEQRAFRESYLTPGLPASDFPGR
jgi:hypothetical protein